MTERLLVCGSRVPTRRYDVTWHRADGESLVCTNLTADELADRLTMAVRNSGPITVTHVRARKVTATRLPAEEEA